MALFDNRKDIFFVMGVTIISISFVSGIEVFTRKFILKNELNYFKKAVAETAGGDFTDEGLDNWFNKFVEEYKKGEIFIVKNKTFEPKTILFIQKGKGLWGTITAAVAVDINDKSIRGISFLSHNETPGLGARIDENSFKKQFYGKKGLFTYEKDKEDLQQIDGITGATISTKAVINIVNTVLLRFYDIVNIIKRM